MTTGFLAEHWHRHDHRCYRALGQNQVMGEAVLALYRSAAQPVMAELGRNLEAAAQRPGLALFPTEDHYVGTEEQRLRAARRAGARVAFFIIEAHRRVRASDRRWP